jgi:mxaA protein
MKLTKRVQLLVLYAVLPSLFSCSPSLQEPVKHFDLQAPKPFGYVIGDEIHHRIVVETRRNLILSKESIPAAGAVNRWLQLKSAKVSVQTASDVDKTELDLTYQVFYSPLEVKMLKIPGFTLRFKQFGQTIEQPVPDWHFTLSPLHELVIRKEADRIYLRPDAVPDQLNVQPFLDRLQLSLFGVLLSALYLAWRHRLLPGQSRRSAFKQASREIAALSSQEIDKALGVIHHALNALNDKPLFKQDLPLLYQRKPQFEAVAPELDWFFNFSSLYFFAGRHYVAEQDFTRLQQLCRRCRKLELETL